MKRNGDAALRVLHIVPDLGLGGAERHVTTLMPRLDRSRFVTKVVCIGGEGELFGDLAAGGVAAVALGRNKRQALRALFELRREIRRFRPDVVIMRGYNTEALGRIAAVLAGRPKTVLWIHNLGDPHGRLRALASRVLEPVTDAYFGVAQIQTEYITGVLGHPAEKVRIIPNGVDVDRFDPVPSKHALAEFGITDQPVVGIVASLIPLKDHETFLRAARLVADVLPDARFVVVGQGPLRDDLERLARELGISASVIFTGPRLDVPDVLRAVDVFVMCSLTEAFPMALLEAMAAGRPAVCTAVADIPRVIEEGVTGYLVEPGKPEQVADRVLAVLTAPDRGRSMGAAARARAEELFSLRRSVTDTERALEDVVGRAAGKRRPVRLTAVLDSASIGGAEMLLLNLFRNLDTDRVTPRVVCLREAGEFAEEFRAAGFEVEALHKKGRSSARTVAGLVRNLRRDRTDVVVTLNYQRGALALGRIGAKLARVPANIVAAHDMGLPTDGKTCLPRWAVETAWATDALVLLSDSHAAYLHREEGLGTKPWRRTREAVVPNGIEIPPRTDAVSRAAARAEMGLPDDAVAVGIVARLSVEKAHETLFAAIAEAAGAAPNVALIVIGAGVREAELRQIAAELGIADRTSFLGRRSDVPQLLPGLDISCLSSTHEAAPMTIIEAMAASLPVVATDVGCVAEMVADGEAGYVVPVGDASAMAARIVKLASDPALRAAMGDAGRSRAESEYRIELTARRYEALLEELVNE